MYKWIYGKLFQFKTLNYILHCISTLTEKLSKIPWTRHKNVPLLYKVKENVTLLPPDAILSFAGSLSFKSHSERSEELHSKSSGKKI